MTNNRIKRNTEVASAEGGKVDEEECCCDDTELDCDLPVVSPTIEDFINIIEESNVLEDRDLSLKLILLVDVFIEIHLYKSYNTTDHRM